MRAPTNYQVAALRPAMLRFALLMGCILTTLIAPATTVHAESRVALVIGNGKYTRDPLPNPPRDAALIAQTLKRVGFAVIEAIDADHAAMQKALVAFSRKLNQPDTVGLFYYAGHGVQVNGENYLLPINVDIRTEAEVLLQGINLNEILVTLRPENNRLAVAILDACRNNPFVGLTRGLKRGLAPVQAPAGTLIAFSTAPGEVALDGTGHNSPYTSALSQSIPAPGLPIEEVFKRTRQRVMQLTGNAQVPWEHSSLTGRFSFVPKTNAEPDGRDALAGATADIRLAEVNAWERVKNATDLTPYKTFLKQYPAGDFAELAQHRIQILTKKQKSWNWWLPRVAVAARPNETVRATAEQLYERGLRFEAEQKSPEDIRNARALYLAAAEANLAPAMYRLGLLIEREARTKHKSGGSRLAYKNGLKEAAGWYAKAVEQAHPASRRALGTLHEFGEGVRKDLAEALRLYKAAAEAGDGSGMTSLGFLYATGKGVHRNPKLARNWYARAAAEGSERAMFNLAIMLMSEDGGDVNVPEAAKWLEEASRKGHPGAMRQLAALFDQGRGLRRDSITAADYLLKAYAGGDRAAKSDLFDNSRRWSRATRRAVQRVLKRDGFYKGAIHGVFNNSTKRGLTAYRRKFSL